MNNNILQTKINNVDELAASISSAKSLLFFNYNGLTGKNATKLRHDLHAKGGKLFIRNNNIYNRALAKANIKMPVEVVGQVGLIVTTGDQMYPFKAIYELHKKTESINFCYGLLEGNVIESSQFNDIANLPSREELYSMLLSVLQGPVRNLMYALKQVEGKK